MPTPLPLEIENPFNLVYDALWDMAERNLTLETWLNPGNKEKFDPQRLGAKRNITTGDTPELILTSDSFGGNFKVSSSSVSISKMYSWQFTTGDPRLNKVANQVSWELFRALADWDKVLCALTWEGTPFVIQLLFAEGVDLPPGSVEVSERGIRGWTILWNVEVHMRFAQETLKIPPPPPPP